jgi:predicted MPP superfamily phosphohydrolase
MEDSDGDEPERIAVGRVMSFVAFFAVVILVLGGLHYYIWARLVRDTRLPQPWAAALLAGLIVVATGLPLMRLVIRRWPGAAQILGWPFYTWLGVSMLLFFLLMGTDVARLLVWIGNKLRSEPAPIDLARRTLVARGVAGVVTAAAGTLTAVALRSALGPVAVKRVPVTLARWPEAMNGFKLVQLTDIHVGPTIGRAFIETIVAHTNALNPDLIAITGDLVDGTVEELRDSVAPLAQLRARHGVYFVTGNHEYFAGAAPWIGELTRLGIRCLRNERVTIGDGDAGFDLAGADDRSGARSREPGHGEDLEKALAGLDPEREVVLLAHQPKSVFAAARFGIGLQISGHTHGGQIWPFSYLVRLQQPFIAGLHRHEGAQVYVSRGTGYWGPPMRLGAPAEITQLVLTRGNEGFAQKEDDAGAGSASRPT